MEFNGSLFRLALLAILIGAFAFMGGFENPASVAGEFHNAQRLTKAWLACVALFCGGAISVSVIDHYVGTLDRTNMRFLYIVIGLGLMTAGVLWGRALREGVSL